MGAWEGIDRFEALQDHIASEWIRKAARLEGDTGSWTRRRDMPLADILRCTLWKKGLTATMELRQYFQAAGNMEQTVSKQDYLKQRQKLNPEVFRLLNRKYLQNFYEGREVKTWYGMVVLAIDGSRVEIPNSAENRREYGESENRYGKAVARANFSGLYDLYNRFFLDIGLHHFRSSEIEEARAHIPELRKIVGKLPTLIIFDRNYVSLEFMNYLEKRGIKYLIRLHSGDYKTEVAGMSRADEEVELAHNKIRLEHLRRTMPEREQELAKEGSTPARILKVTLDNGEKGALITNLTGQGAREIKRLYRKRWLIEQKYHTLKNKLKFESVTGRASIYVEQDFRAQVLVFNMVQDLITLAERRLKQRSRKQGYWYEMRINENIAIGLYKEQFIRLILEEDTERKNELFLRLKEAMMKNIVPVRILPGRKRRWKYFNKYKCNQKPSFGRGRFFV
jgi:hypothetical protein